MPVPRDSFGETLSRALERWGIPITSEELRQLRAHFEAVVETNRVMNLTRITDPVEAAIKHYADSLALLLWSRDRSIAVRTVLDVGTGAGFPALPLAVMRPDWSVTALDATRKKVEFLARVVETIGMNNLRVEHGNTAHWTTDLRFDVVAARAFGPLAKCVESCAGLVAPGGRLVVYKTEWLTLGELEEAEQLLKKARLEKDEPFGYDLHINDETLHRTLHLFRRV